MDKTYTQCKLVKGNTFQTAWIPSSFAKLGQVIRYKDDGAWDDGWRVVSVGGTSSKEWVEEYETYHRKLLGSVL